MIDQVRHNIWLVGRFLRYLGHTFVHDRLPGTAAGLAYTFLLALVPLTTMAFSLLAAFPVFQSLGDPLNDFIFSNFVPASGEVVQEHLLRFAEQSKRLTAVGTIVLLITALMMLRTIDQAINDIWKIRIRRRGVSAFLVYWAVLTLGPILIGVSIAVTSYIVSLPLLSDTSATLRKPLLAMVPFFLTTIAFTLVYLAIPNRRVAPRIALAGGVVAGLLFELAKRGFAWYVTSFPTYELIYGALAAIPIFLVWVYLSWLIILFGAGFTYCLTTFQPNRIHHDIHRHPGLISLISLIATLEMAQREGRTVEPGRLLRDQPAVDEDELRQGLALLLHQEWIGRDQQGDLYLRRDLDDLTLYDLYAIVPWNLAEAASSVTGDPPWGEAVGGVLHRADDRLREEMRRPLRQLFHRIAEEGEPGS